jgi:phosphatidylglycerol lysyltransferase
MIGQSARRIVPFVIIAVFIAALWLLHRSLDDSRLHEVLGYIGALSPGHIAAAALFTIAGYVALTGYDVLALRYVQRPLPYRETALTSFISYAFTHNLGFGALTGGSVRYRLYSLAGLNGLEITAVIAFCGLTFALGSMVIAGVVLAAAPARLAGLEGLAPVLVRLAGLLLLALVAAWLIGNGIRRRPVTIGRWSLTPPSARLTTQQILLSCFEHMLTAAALYQLLPAGNGLSYPALLGIYVIAIVASVVSHVPGGLGVFETVIVMFLPGVPPAQVLGALLAFRLVYYLLPLAVAAALLATHELTRRRPALARIAHVVRVQLTRLAPQLAAAVTFVAGTVLLLSGAVPTKLARLDLLNQYIPLPIIEVSHFAGSVVGVGLLLLARGLLRRLDAAYLLAVVLIAAGIVASLLRGLAYEEALVLACLGVLLAPARDVFYRRAALFDLRLSGGWIAAIAMVVIGSIWVGFFAFRHVEYSHDLWWQFALDAKAPRFLRASLAVAIVGMAAALWQLLRPAPPPPILAKPADLERARRIIAASPDAPANVALLGDKSLLFSDRGTAFIMYGVHGRSWVALGDPVGPVEERAELAWKFRELCDRFDGRPVFYQVDPENLPLYVDLGLSLLKIGEEARLSLQEFSLDNPAYRDLRYARRRAEREGGSFEIVEPAGVLAIMPELQEVSDVWLTERKTREKGFSVGFFSADYLKNFHCAVARKGGRIVAFATVWLSGEKEEISIDLMRYRAGALYGAMDFLFAELLLWGQREGYRWFSLGMAPLAGLEARPLAPVWYRLGAFAYKLGEHFYNFQGLRAYKAKFAPAWKPKYLATRGGLSVGPVLLDVAALVSDDVRGIFVK